MNEPKKVDNMLKLSFKLEVEDDWPPLKVENLWLKKLNDCYEVRYIPFFIDNLEFMYLVEIESIEPELYQIKKVKKRSQNSTWLLLIDEKDIKNEVLKIIKDLGCRYETGVLKGYYTINMPPEVEVEEFELLLQCYLKTESILLDYPFVFGEEN